MSGTNNDDKKASLLANDHLQNKTSVVDNSRTLDSILEEGDPSLPTNKKGEDDKTEQTANDSDENGEYEYDYKAISYAAASCTFADMSYSMLVSFFPTVAKDRGLDSIQIGILFASFQFANFFTCFFAPKVNQKFGGIMVLQAANTGQAIVAALFAFTSLLHESHAFFWTFLLLRVSEGFLAALAEVAASGIAVRSVPKDKATEAVAEVASYRILGEVIGPLAGGAFYGWIGYSGPYIFAASCFGILATIMFVWRLDPSLDNKSDGKDDDSHSVPYKFIKLPMVLTMCVAFMYLSSAFAFLEPTLQPFLAKAPYSCSHLTVGAIYLTAVTSFAIVTGSLGYWLRDKLGISLLIRIGLFLIPLAYFIMAPAPHFEDPLTINAFLYQSRQFPAIVLIVVGLSLMWLGGGLMFIPVNEFMIKEAEYHGMSIEHVSDAVGVATNMSFTLGAGIGPLIGGILNHSLSFPKANILYAYLLLPLCAAIMTAMHLITSGRPGPEDQDNINETSVPSGADETGEKIESNDISTAPSQISRTADSSQP